ncbi:MAG TPA: hypothetical protein VGN12_28750 [Pirellulales bacterium]|jgi:hypothetical protein
MHTVELLERALGAAASLGYHVRQDWLDGPGGGCEIKGEKWLFLDLASSPLDKLHIVADALSRERAGWRDKVDPALRQFLETRRAA